MIAKKTVSCAGLNYEGVTTLTTYYGLANTSAYKKNYVDYLSNEIVAFLKECGVSSARYEDSFVWINGVPIGVRVTNASSNNFSISYPFLTNNGGAFTWLQGTGNTASFTFNLYFAGNSETFVFSINAGSYCYHVWIVNGRNVARGTKAVGLFMVFVNSLTYSAQTAIYPYDFDSSGNIEAFGGDATQSTKYEILKLTSSSFAADFTRYRKFPLRHQFLSFFEFDSYINPANSGYTNSAAPGPNHTVLEIDGEQYVLLPLLDFVKM